MNLHRGTVPALDKQQISHKNFELEKIDFTKWSMMILNLFEITTFIVFAKDYNNLVH